MSRGVAQRGICALTLYGLPMLGATADWNVQSSAQMLAQVESNPRLLSEDSQSAQAGIADLSLDLTRRTELLDVNISARGSVRRYSEDVKLDRDDQRLNVSLEQRGEEYSLAASLMAARDTTLTSELGTTGLIEANQRHASVAATLSPSWQLTERITAGASAAWQLSRYAKSAPSGLVGYQYSAVAVNVARNFTEKSGIGLSARAGRLNSDRQGGDSDNIELLMQAQYIWSPLWRGTLSGGPSRVRANGVNRNGSVYGATLTRIGERMNVDASLRRSAAPTGLGLLSRRDEASVTLRAALLEHLDGTASMSLIRTTDYVPQFGFTLSDVRYVRADLSLSWQFARNWNLGLGAGVAEQKLLFSNSTGRSYDARLQFAWRRATPVG